MFIKKVVLLLGASLVVGFSAVAPVWAAADEVVASTMTWRTEKNGAFSVGEKLDFSIRWKFIRVGSAAMEVRSSTQVAARESYHLFTAARSAAFFDVFFKVRDTNESWMDMQSLSSLQYEANISEGGYRRRELLVFDQLNHSFLLQEWEKKEKKEDKSGVIPPWVHDVLSALYYVRTQPLKIGDTLSIDAHAGDKSWPLIVKVVKKQRVKVPAGKFSCIVVEPAIRENAGIFQAKGTLHVWLTDDAHHMPVKMRSKVAIGSITAELSAYSRQK